MVTGIRGLLYWLASCAKHLTSFVVGNQTRENAILFMDGLSQNVTMEHYTLRTNLINAFCEIFLFEHFALRIETRSRFLEQR